MEKVIENNNPFEIVNISKNENGFTGFHGGQPYEFRKGEKKMLPKYVAEHIAKQMLDKVLQEEHNIKDTVRDTPQRRELLYKILVWKKEMDEQSEKDLMLKRQNVDATVEVQKLKKENAVLKGEIASVNEKMDKILEKLDNKDTGKPKPTNE